MQKIALIYDDLVQFGGGEEFFKNICLLYKNADIFCPIVSKRWQKKLKVKHSKFLSILLIFKKPGYYLASFLSIFWFESLNLNSYSTVISLCNRFSGVVITGSNTKHICIYTYPFRALYNNSINKLISFFVKLYLFYALKRPNVNLAISDYTKKALQNYLGLQVNHIIFPPSTYKHSNKQYSDANYFLIVGRCTMWKKPYFEKAINVFANNNKKLVVVGDYYKKQGLVKKFANNKNITFVGRVNKKILKNYYKNCSALIHPQIEDFGLTPLEALSFNKPIIYYNRGGVCEYLNNKVAISYNKVYELKKAVDTLYLFKFDELEAKNILNKNSMEAFLNNLNCVIKKTK